MNNVLLTPHLAASSLEALKRLSMDVAKKLLKYLGYLLAKHKWK
jgi:phosphoglycerate dehydrogenase-like enzyme